MGIVVVVIIILGLLYFLYFKEDKSTPTITKKDNPTKATTDTTSTTINTTVIEPQDILIDEDGEEYYLVNKIRQVPRKSYLKGNIIGKYHGDTNPILDEFYHESKFFDFNIYEIVVNTVSTQSYPFDFTSDSRFPRERLPEKLPVVLEKDNRQFALNILEPQLQNVKFDRKLHQTEGNEVFGTIKAEITGYILDFVDEHYTERVYIKQVISEPPPTQPGFRCIPTGIPTGNVETKPNYKRTEYWCSNHKDTYWSNWIYTGPPIPPGGRPEGPGCFSILAGIIGVILLILFLTALGPKGIFSLVIFGIILLLLGFFSEIIKWLFRIILAIMLIGLIITVINSILGKRTFKPHPILKDSTEVKRDSLISTDSVIIQHRIWNDYDNHVYEGDYWIKVLDLKKSSNYKNGITAGYNQYDQLLNTLYNFDVNKLNGVYHLLDSIKLKNKQNDVQFAETVVCFVQDIPYTLVLEQACNASLYNDPFTRSYLDNNQGDCDPYEKFGINTPVQFMAALKGDCDTRTLLLFTLLSHFNYDVAILSSDYYSHSILGVNLPISGDALVANGKKYVVWETTSAGVRPGILPREVSDLNYWRISLQSKP